MALPDDPTQDVPMQPNWRDRTAQNMQDMKALQAAGIDPETLDADQWEEVARLGAEGFIEAYSDEAQIDRAAQDGRTAETMQTTRSASQSPDAVDRQVGVPREDAEEDEAEQAATQRAAQRQRLTQGRSPPIRRPQQR